MKIYYEDKEPKLTWAEWFRVLLWELARLALTLGVIGLWAFILWAGAQ